jgi:hypothetical protein
MQGDVEPSMMRPAVCRFPVLTIRGGLSTIEVQPGVSAGLTADRLKAWWKGLTCFGSRNGLDWWSEGRSEGGRDSSEDNNLFEVFIVSQLLFVQSLAQA